MALSIARHPCAAILRPILVFPRERRRLSSFAHGPSILAHERRIAFPFSIRETVYRVFAYSKRVAFLDTRVELVIQEPTDC
jgi:hypothetical protein